MTITVHNQVEADNMVLISQLYHGAVYSNHDDVVPAPQEPKVKARRQRRKKSKAETSNAVARKRKLSAQQVDLLEQYFDNEHKLESERKDRLASELGLDPRQVAVWFQNRRARWKNKKLEEEFSKLKAAHENAVVEKCRLESEVMKLKEQLDEARNEIQRLSSDGVISSHSPMSSSISVDANVDPPFLGEFGVQGYDEPDDVFYMPENNYGYIQSMEWFNLYM